MSSLWLEILYAHKQSSPLIIWTIAAPVFLMIITHLISTFHFHRIARTAKPGSEPPTAPYWLPGLYHLPGLMLGPSPYIQRLLNGYGSLAPFFFRAGPVRFLVVTDPSHIKSIFLASKQITPKTFHLTVFEKVLGLPKPAVEIYAADESKCKETKAVNFAHLTLNRKYMSGTALTELTELYVRALRKNLSRMNFDSRRWTTIEDIWAFFRREIPNATIEVILGPSILDMHPDIVGQFWAFDDNLQEYSRRLLRHALTTSPYAARDRILGSLKAWISSSQPEIPDTEAITKEAFWNPNTGSKLFRHRDSIFAGIPGMGLDGRASETLGLLQAANANTVPSTFWYIFEALKDDDLRHRLKCELDSHSDDILSICSSPLLQSMQSEVTRCRMATAVIRRVEADDVILAGRYSIPKGTTVLAFPSDSALNTEAWRKIRPQSVMRPLEKFWAERFLTHDTRDTGDESAEKNPRKDNSAMKYSTEGLNALHFTFGGGQNMCPGKAWAKNIQIATLAVLFTDYEVELIDVEAANSLIPPLRQTAVGTIKPLAKVGVRIRARSEQL
ncbi:cytochrome P450 [Lophiotrema nucula]|uniref:Cytochrome P450 n=1 Tax=Lophiotrema nucula TaxID=690887 RepID=A0A6A5ZPS4_9PLEO|nr:cytochrome P450 [Lophiotrema nucula]